MIKLLVTVLSLFSCVAYADMPATQQVTGAQLLNLLSRTYTGSGTFQGTVEESSEVECVATVEERDGLAIIKISTEISKYSFSIPLERKLIFINRSMPDDINYLFWQSTGDSLEIVEVDDGEQIISINLDGIGVLSCGVYP